MRLKDKVTLITGGAAGIGKATALKFAAEGATVVICDVNEEVGQATAALLGPAAAFYKVNVADRAAVQVWVDAVVEKYGRVDVLVNNAGIVRDNQLVRFKEGQLVKQMPEADFDLVIAINLKGVFNCTQAVAPVMIRQGDGVILNASSVVGLGKFGVRVNAVAPGFTATEILSAMPEKVIEGMVARTPLGRMGQPADIANAYLFLASDEASFISGAVLRVDGGLVVGT
jgi:3-oxoacyl-[acyl-carrier protein] reductase